MSIGNAWKGWMGSLDKESAFKLLDKFYEQGGNFIDTSPNYQDEQSEQWIGEWMAERGVRDQIVLATKYTTNWQAYKLKKQIHAVNFGGNNRKNMHLSTNASLKNLKTDYIDILYVHWWGEFSSDISVFSQC
jgi:aryl-alcohol dehydrogenase-like predicted oxidoreductase